MNSESRFIQAAVWGFLGIIVLSVVGVYLSTVLLRPTPPLPVYGDVPQFALTNQFDRVTRLDDLKGNVWIADIIFTRCPGPCLQMTRRMKAIQAALAYQPDVKLVSLTADPLFDTPKVLHDYAERLKADPKNWLFLTGPKQSVYDLAMKGLKLAVDENSDSVPLSEKFIHSTRFVLIDRLGRLRSVSFDGTERDTVSDLVRAVNALAKER
jgi:protein SCO1/2